MKLRWLREGNRARTPWLLALGCGAAIAWILAQQFNVGVAWRLCASIAAVVVPIIIGELHDVFGQNDERTKTCRDNLRSYSPRRGVPLVGTLHDLSTLGVTHSRGSGRGDASVYVRRDRDDDLDRMLGEDNFVLVIGDSKVGKSRTAAEAMRRKFGDRRVIIPDSAGSIPALLDIGLDFENSVVWLDELEHYLDGTGLNRLLDYLAGADAPKKVCVLGTIREKVYASYIPDGGLESPYWRVLNRANRVRIDRLMTAAELDRAAAAFHDPHLLDALDHYGLAEYLSAGPDLLEKLESGFVAEPVGAIAVVVAADWSRTGLNRPIPLEVLSELVPVYAEVNKLPIGRPGPGDIKSALSWAQKPVYGASQLLSAMPGGFAAFDYLLDHGTHADVPDRVWHAALTEARGDELIQVGLAANELNRLDIAVQAFEIAVQFTGVLFDPTAAALNYAIVLEKLGRLDEAKEYYRKAADEGNLDAALAAGRLLEAGGQVSEAERYYRMAADAGSPDGTFALGMLLSASDADAALPWLEQAAQAGHVQAAIAAGQLREAAGQVGEAERCYRLAADAGSPAGAFALGRLLRESDADAALPWFEQAAQAGHVEAAYAASRLLELRGQNSEAGKYRRIATAASQMETLSPSRRMPTSSQLKGGRQVLRSASEIVEQANLLETQMTAYSDAELRQRSASLRRLVQRGEHVDSVAPEAFALAREAIRRVLGQACDDAHLLCAAVLHSGQIAEMSRGKDRPLAAMIAAYLNALSGQPVHIVTLDEPTARGEFERAKPIYSLLGMEAGLIFADMTHEARAVTYRADVVYAKAEELIFDCLRNRLAWSIDERTLRGTGFAIVDQADLVLLNNPFADNVISAEVQESRPLTWYREMARIAARLRPGVHYVADVKEFNVDITEAGIRAIEDWLGIDNLYAEDAVWLVPYVDIAIKAKEMYKRGEKYVVHGGEVVIIDETTGEFLHGRRFGDNLHQALEAKEGLQIRNEIRTLARMGKQAYFALYRKLSGLSDTATAEARAFKTLFGLSTLEIPAMPPRALVQNEDLLFYDNDARWNEAADLIAEHHELGQPVVVDTSSADRAKKLSQILSRRGLVHELVMPASYSSGRTELAGAGRKGAITVGVNLYRITDSVELGGQDAEPRDHDDVAALGGLMVIGTERRVSRALDERLLGLTAVGDEPGESVFMLAREDDLAQGILWGALSSLVGDLPISSQLISRALRSRQNLLAEARTESLARNLAYANVFEQQRALIYEMRDQILEGQNLNETMLSYLHATIDQYLASRFRGKRPSRAEITELSEDLNKLTGGRLDRAAIETGGRQGFGADSRESDQRPISQGRDIASRLHKEADRIWEKRAQELGQDVWFELQRRVLLNSVDELWRDHIREIDQLRATTGMASAWGEEALSVYRSKAHLEFESLQQRLQRTSVSNLMNLNVSIVPDESIT